MKPPLNATFVHRQTMADAMRFSTTELVEIEAKMSSAADQALAREQTIFDQLTADVLAAEAAIKGRRPTRSQLSMSPPRWRNSPKAASGCAPTYQSRLPFGIEGGRHPVVEAALAQSGKPFVANDCTLSADYESALIAVVTGPCSSVLNTHHGLPSDSTSRWTPLLRRTVPLTTARRGLSPPKHSTCVAHIKKPSEDGSVKSTLLFPVEQEN